MRWASGGLVLALWATFAGCASGIPTRLETQVRHHYTCGLGTISGHLISRTDESETYAVDACGGNHLVAVCPTGARTRFQPCTYESATSSEGSEVVYGPPRHVAEAPASQHEADAGPVAEADETVEAEPEGEADAAVVEAPSRPSAEAAARAAIDAHRAALLACTGGAAALRLTWTAEGQLTVVLRDTPDSDEERCIRAALAGVTIDAGGAPGTALHAIAP